MRLAGNFRVVLCGGDGSKAGRLVSFSTIVAAYRRVVPDSCHRVGDSSGSGSGGRAVAVADFLRGRAHPCPATACAHSGA